MRIKSLLIGLGALLLSLPAHVLAGPPPVNPVFSQPTGMSTMTVTWGDPGGTLGFIIEASTDANFIGTVHSSRTLDTAVTTLTISGLTANTSYYVQAGALNGTTTDYAPTNP